MLSVLVSYGAKPRQIYSSADAGNSAYDNGGTPASNYRGTPVRGLAGSWDCRQKHRDHATGYAECSPAAGRLEHGGPSGQKKTSKDRASTYVQQKQIASSSAALSRQSPAVPQSASLSHKMPRSMYFRLLMFSCTMINFRNQRRLII